MENSKLVWAIFFFIGVSLTNYAQKNIKVNIQVTEAGSLNATPVMVCITSLKDGKPRIPPQAIIPSDESLHQTQNIYLNGVAFENNKNWIGPVRKMSGQGDNDDRSYVYENIPSLPYWKDPVMFQTSGNFSIYLTPGKWRINLQHGNEFIPVEDSFTLSNRDNIVDKNYTLSRWINLPQRGWYSGDIHVHHPTTKPEFKEYLLQYAKAEDLHIVNLLTQGNDHEIKGAPQEGFGKKFRICKEDICLISGQEDPSSRFGHIIGLNINQLVRDTSTYNYYDLVFKQLHQQPEALVGFAHFSWNGCDLPRGFPWLVTTNEIDFVELLQFAKINTLDYYDYLNLGFRITAAAGSDFPWGSTIGEVRTVVYTGNNFSVDTWFNGLQEGNTYVTNGPALFFEADGKLPGTELAISKGTRTSLKVKAISHPAIGKIDRIALYNNDGLLKEFINNKNQDSLTLNVEHILQKSEWIAAVVYCSNGAVAHTSPIYFIVDRQPTWSVTRASAIIQKQLTLLDQIDEEERKRKPVDDGIIIRLKTARKFYSELLLTIGELGR